jgi:hypothetical protein
MPVRQVFEWGTVDGRPFTTIEDWVSTLDPEQQQEYHRSRQQQSAYRQAAIDNGDMIMTHSGDYVWKDEAAARRGKASDAVWEQYWLRWQNECAITFSSKFIEE